MEDATSNQIVIEQKIICRGISKVHNLGNIPKEELESEKTILSVKIIDESGNKTLLPPEKIIPK